MIFLSQAIIKGAEIAPATSTRVYFAIPELPGHATASDPLGAAYLGSLKPESVPHFWAYVRDTPQDILCKYMLNKLMTKFPHLGASVRTWPRLAEELERDRLVPRIRTNQTNYRQEIHRSLWKVITDMHAAGESKGQIAEYLGRHGL